MAKQENPAAKYQHTDGTPRMIKHVMYEALVRDRVEDTDEVLERIFAEFPTANSGPKDVSWYRWQFREAGLLPKQEKLTPEERKARKAAYEASYKAKQEQLKAERRAAARAEQDAAEAKRFADAVAAAVAAELAKRGLGAE